MSALSIVRSLCIVCLVIITLGSGCVIQRNSRADRESSEVALNQNVFGLWVTRWDFRTKSDIDTIINDCASMGITDIYWQIRGQGDAYYQSELEPWGEELTRPHGDKDAKPAPNQSNRVLDPGFDPLAYAIRQAHLKGMRVHAWLNVMPLWRGKTPPIDTRHAFYTRPHWRLIDENGQAQPLGDGYVVVNPVLDDVQNHIVKVVRDVVTRYRVDGVHLDYIRFLTDELGSEKLYPGDSRSLSLYARMEGGRATVGQINRTKYRAWIRSRITHLVDRIGKESLDGHPEVEYSAAVWRRPDLAKDQYLQDATQWVNDGMVDLVMPMIYTDKDTQFENDLESWYLGVDRNRVIPGIGTYKHNSGGQTLSQASLGHPRRFALFAYSSIFESSNPDQDKKADAIRERELKRDAITQFINRVGN